jgi:hypothetical protein
MDQTDATQTRTAGAPESDLELSWRRSFIPLFCLLAGGFAGEILARVPGLTEPLKAALGPGLGTLVTTPDNSGLGLGLFTLLLSAAVLWRTERPRLKPGTRPGEN